jgi:hypothetical protein
MDITTFRRLARSYNTRRVDDDEQSEILYGHARTFLTPILPIWKSLAQQSVRNWPSTDSPDPQYNQAGITKMYADEFSDGRHDIYFVRTTYGSDWESVEDDEDDGSDFGCIMDPRFQGMFLGICSLLPEDCLPHYFSPDRIALTRKLLQNHPIEKLMDNDEMEVISIGIENMGWGPLKSIGVKWMRLWYSARAIQRAYKARLRRKRARMIQQVLLPIIVRNKRVH